MFNFFNMMGNYESRKVGRYEGDNFFVSTAMVTDDSEYPYETAISHPDYANASIIVVEQYENIEAAEIGHEKWVKIFTSETLPEYIIECHAGGFGKLAEAMGVVDIDDRIYRTACK